MTLSNFSSSVNLGMNFSELFDTVRGFQTGRSLIMRPLQPRHEEFFAKGESSSQWHYFSKKCQLLAYADDIDILGCTKRDVTDAFSAIER